MSACHTGAWIHLCSGRAFDFDAPTFEPDDLHALRREYRYAGHADWTVDDHTIGGLRAFDWSCEEARNEWVLHDCHEAYVRDMPTPIKRLLPDYQALENRIAEALRMHYLGRPDFLHIEEVKEADAKMLWLERHMFFGPSPEGYSWGSALDTPMTQEEYDRLLDEDRRMSFPRTTVEAVRRYLCQGR